MILLVNMKNSWTHNMGEIKKSHIGQGLKSDQSIMTKRNLFNSNTC